LLHFKKPKAYEARKNIFFSFPKRIKKKSQQKIGFFSSCETKTNLSPKTSKTKKKPKIYYFFLLPKKRIRNIPKRLNLKKQNYMLAKEGASITNKIPTS
jgi:hypothetical protein